MAILFDLDGTLIDTAYDFYTALNQLFSELDLLPVEYTELRAQVSEGANALLKLRIKVKEDSAEFLELRQKFLTYYKDTKFKDTKLFAGISDILQLIEKNSVPWGVVTNKPEWLTMPLMESLHLTSRASCIVAGDTVAYAKPHPAPLFEACSLLNVLPNKCVYIGDAKRDIEAGSRAGMTTVAALYGYIQNLNEPSSWEADYQVENTNELKQWVKTWLGIK